MTQSLQNDPALLDGRFKDLSEPGLEIEVKRWVSESLASEIISQVLSVLWTEVSSRYGPEQAKKINFQLVQKLQEDPDLILKKFRRTSGKKLKPGHLKRRVVEWMNTQSLPEAV